MNNSTLFLLHIVNYLLIRVRKFYLFFLLFAHTLDYSYVLKIAQCSAK